MIRTHRMVKQSVLIAHLNPVILGWANYYSTVVSTETFSKADCHLFQLLKVWAYHRHPNKAHQWVISKYWRTVGNDRWSFVADIKGSLKRLLKHSETPSVRHIKVQGVRSPYDGDWIYWSTRMGRHPTLMAEVAKLLKRQQGKCPCCGLYFKDGDLLESDHIVPNNLGGSETLSNKQLLHRHCHDQKTSVDGSYKARTTASLSEEESQQKEKLLKAWNPYKDKQRQSDEEWRKQWQ